jgi:hypothetical protein
MKKPALEARLVEVMRARSLANLPARCDLVEADRARTDPCVVVASKFIEINNSARLQRPSLRLYSGSSRLREELEDAAHVIAERNEAAIEDVDFHCVGDKR